MLERLRDDSMIHKIENEKARVELLINKLEDIIDFSSSLMHSIKHFSSPPSSSTPTTPATPATLQESHH